MARDSFVDTIGQAGSDGNYKPLGNIQVDVYFAGTTTHATIYVARTGSTQVTNPFTTAAGGAVEFWADVGDYDVKFHDLTVPARIGDKTIGWNALNGGTAGIPSNRLAADAGIPIGAMDATAMRQFVPIGAVIDWWRPDNTVAVPTGWAICDGTSVLAANHDFGTGANFNLPDLRNAFVLGASTAIGDNTAATAGDAAGNAPGIRGSGGSHFKNLSHSHTVTSHTHSVTAEAPGTSANGTHSHTGFTGAPTQLASNIAGGGSAVVAGQSHNHDVFTYDSGSHSHNVNSHSHGGATGSASPTTNTGLSASEEIRPKYVGLLKIMKIKRN